MSIREQDRTFAEVADRFIAWQGSQTASIIERAWRRLGWRVSFVAGLPQMTTHPDCARSVRADRTSRMALAPARGNRYAARTSSLLILPHPSSTLAPSGGTGGASPCPPSRLWYPRTARGVVCARRRQDKGVCTNGPESAPALAATGTPTPPRTPEGHVHGSGVSPGSMRVPHDPHPQVPPQGCLQMLTCYATRP